eukprot:gene10055-biopygen13815
MGPEIGPAFQRQSRDPPPGPSWRPARDLPPVPSWRPARDLPPVPSWRPVGRNGPPSRSLASGGPKRTPLPFLGVRWAETDPLPFLGVRWAETDPPPVPWRPVGGNGVWCVGIKRNSQCQHFDRDTTYSVFHTVSI